MPAKPAPAFLAHAERAFGPTVAAEAARIYREQGEAAARRFLAGFDCWRKPGSGAAAAKGALFRAGRP